MFFRVRYIVHHFGLHQTPETLEIDNIGTPPVKILLHPLKEEDIKEFCEENDWVALVSTEEEVTEKVLSQFRDAEKEPTQAVKEVSAGVGRRMNSALTDFLKVVRWRTGIYGSHKLIRCNEKALEWSLEGENWAPLRWFSILSLGTELGAVAFNPALFDDIKRALHSEDYEPAGHELLREAWNLRDDSPRSALMLGVAALEVGVKECIAKLVPEAEWLCFEMPAPPVVRMLEEYLPKLPVKLKINGKVFIPEKIVKTLKKAITKRNQVTHKGEIISNDESLADILMNIQMTLYFLDYYTGHPWAVDKIRDSDIYNLLMKELTDS